MGVMNTMRDNMAGIMIFLVVVFVLTMSVGGLVGGADITDLLSGNKPNAFTVVNGEEITRETFMRALQNERDGYRARTGIDPDEQQMIKLSDQVWETIVTQTLIKQEIEKQEIQISPDEIKYFFTENIHPAVRQYFTNEQGEFDYNSYQQAINAPEASSFFAAMRQQIAALVPVEKLQQKVIATAQVSESEVRSEYIKNNISYELDYLFINSSLWKDDEIEVTDSEISTYYQDNIDDYYQEETRVLNYLSIPITPSSQDTARAQSLLNDIKSEILAGASFESLAEIHSTDPSGSNGGYLGWFGKGRMVPPFEEAAFSAKVGELVGPVLTRFGYHLIRIDDKRIKDGNQEVEARHILIDIKPSATTRDRLRRELKNIEFLADEIGFKKAVDSLGYELSTSNKLKRTDTFVSGLGLFQSAVRFAYFSTVGDYSKVMQNDNNFALFSLKEIIPAGPRPLNDVKAGIKRKLINEKKLSLAHNAAEELGKSLDETTDFSKVKLDRDGIVFQHVKDVKGTSTIPGLGRYQILFGYLSQAVPGAISPVIEIPRGSVILRLVKRSDFSEADYLAKYDELYDELTNKRKQDVWRHYLEDLRAEADIQDNRLKFL